MSNQFLNMGLSSLQPFQFSLSDIFEKVRCYSACCGGQVIIEESTDKESEKYSGEDLDTID